MEEKCTTGRPTLCDSQILREAAEKLFPEIEGWLKQGDPSQDIASEREEILGQLVDALDLSYDLDGYRLAKSLEDRGWLADSSLVDILDSASSYIYTALTNATKAWVKENNIQPPLAVGTVVTWKSDGVRGTIVNTREDTAEYVIQEEGKCYPKPSEIKQADGATKKFFCGLILPYERALAVETPHDQGS